MGVVYIWTVGRWLHCRCFSLFKKIHLTCPSVVLLVVIGVFCLTGNLALSQSVKTGNPVRVIRGYKLPTVFAPESGYRYDGLYNVTKAWLVLSKSKNFFSGCIFSSAVFFFRKRRRSCDETIHHSHNISFGRYLSYVEPKLVGMICTKFSFYFRLFLGGGKRTTYLILCTGIERGHQDLVSGSLRWSDVQVKILYLLKSHRANLKLIWWVSQSTNFILFAFWMVR